MIKPINENNTINAIIEISAGSYTKYEFNEELQILELDRIMPTTMAYPANYGFIPNTRGQDGDALDVLVICSESIVPGALVKVRPIGMLVMEDESGMDEKIICLPDLKTDQYCCEMTSLECLPKIVLKKIEHFFTHYKELEKGKWVKIGGWKPASDAMELIKNSMN